MSEIVGDGPCPQCRSNGRDKTGNHLILFSNGNKYCNRCDYKEVQCIVKKQFDPNELSSPTQTYRGITPDVLNLYGTKFSFSEETGELESVCYPRTKESKKVGYKCRILPKEFVCHGSVKGSDFFGRKVAGDSGKMIVVTEGEDDAMIAYQMFRDRGKTYRVISLPDGANLKGIENNLDYLNRFEKVVLCFDQDEAGQKLAASVSDMLPEKTCIMKFSEKDAQDMYHSSKKDEFFSSLFNASPHKPDGIVSIDDVIADAIKPPQWGLPWPWPTLTKLTYGRRRKEIYGFGAGVGCGKTEAFKEIVEQVISKDSLVAGLFFLEEPAPKTVRTIAGKIANKQFHKPDSGIDPLEIEEGIKKLNGKIYLYNHFGYKDWSTIKRKIRYMALALGIKDIFIDHLTALVAEEDNKNDALNRIMADMSSLANSLDISIYYISHLRTPDGTSHEEGGRVKENQFIGSRAIAQWSHYMFALERNKQHEDSAMRNTVTFRVLKDREYGTASGETFYLRYNHDTGKLNEVDLDTEYGLLNDESDEPGIHEGRG